MEKYSLQFRNKMAEPVLQAGNNKVVQLSLEPGQELTKHKTTNQLILIVLTGKIRFTVDDETEVLSASEMLTIAPSVEHAVQAVERSTVLLVLLHPSQM